MRSAFLLCVLALLLPSCGDKEQAEAADLNLTISGDTVTQLRPIEVNGVARSAECRTVFTATVQGGTEGEVRVVGGHVEFRNPAAVQASLTWDSASIRTVWPEPSMKAGTGRGSMPFGISVSLPAQDMEGSVTFDYRVPGSDELHTTTPFTFKCR